MAKSCPNGIPKAQGWTGSTPNTYERVAWATAGSRAILEYPQSVGALVFPFSKQPFAPPKMARSEELPGIATHIGWVELGLAFGIPILGLIFSLYTVGEVAIQHGLEILHYLLAFIPALLLTKLGKDDISN